MNKLLNESSPYLRQHASNPVWWYPWGAEALEVAKLENKLLIVSIGYSACHWCHVMEHESFSDNEVAEVMNVNFVNIKVDREERPDIDQIYMEALQMMTGRGGWPLNCICLPDGRPVYAGSYFTRSQWLDVLGQLQKIHAQNGPALLRQAEALAAGLQEDQIKLAPLADLQEDRPILKELMANWIPTLDFVFGGHKGAPKFALPSAWIFALAYLHLNGGEQIEKILKLTLNKMYRGGLYDHIQGGFSRYCVDEAWEVPHFEKMLYDNAQLLVLYSQGLKYFKTREYRTVVLETVNFLLEELKQEDGLFSASLDADSEGEEGKYYIWTYKAVKEILQEDTALFACAYDLHPRGNWEGAKNILHRIQNDRALSEEFEMNEQEVGRKLEAAKLLLKKARSTRVPPGKDDKKICAWNALMLLAFLECSTSTGEEVYLQEALLLAQAIDDKFRNRKGGLYRLANGGKHAQNAFLDDYAFTIGAFISLYEHTFDLKWLEKAKVLCEFVIAHFSGESDAYFYYSSDLDEKLIARKRELSDNVIPSSNSQMAINIWRLSSLYKRADWKKIALNMLQGVCGNIPEGGAYFSNWALLYLNQEYGILEVCIIGEDWKSLLREMRGHYLPHVIFSGGDNEKGLPAHRGKKIDGETLIYVCKDNTCFSPVHTTAQALELIARLN